MSDLLLPFALRIADGLFVSPDEVLRGRACNCVCPSCQNPVQARHGTERVWHFAHAKAGNCAGAYAKSIHETAKQMLRDRKELLLPALTVTASATDAFHRLIQEIKTVFDAKHVTLDACLPGQIIDDVSPDLVGTFSDRRLIVEITVFHRLMPEKQERLKKTGLAILEIDLAEFKTKQVTRELLEAALFSRFDNRRWISHPAVSAAQKQIQDTLHQRLKTAQEELLEQQQKNRQAEPAQQASFTEVARHLPRPTDGGQLRHKTWRASFPVEDARLLARDAFCERHSLSTDEAQKVFGNITNRGELARTTPEQLSHEWAHQLGVDVHAILQYFSDAGYTL